MSIISRIRQRTQFYLEQDLGILKPSDIFSVSKGIFRKYLPSNPVVVDCGSHIGTDSIELARIFPKAAIHSFEPVPAIFRLLQLNTASYKNISCYSVALGDTDGEAEMHISSQGSDASSSLLRPAEHLRDHPSVLFETIVRVDVKKLDTWAASSNIQNIDLLWLDMQGFEYQMLNASPKILSTVKVIHTEISTKETYAGVLTYTEFQKWLESKGFEVLIEAIPEGSDMGNVVFVRTDK
jgi:FkbM family methyltransferase